MALPPKSCKIAADPPSTSSETPCLPAPLNLLLGRFWAPALFFPDAAQTGLSLLLILTASCFRGRVGRRPSRAPGRQRKGPRRAALSPGPPGHSPCLVASPPVPTALSLSEGSGHRFFPIPKFTFSPGKLRGTGLPCSAGVWCCCVLMLI